ncbi:MAG: insulinase family protein [Deltaproteobacteria bacterium]|nr:insulinase family protein [Deltaproteobacteria bacterium]
MFTLKMDDSSYLFSAPQGPMGENHVIPPVVHHRLQNGMILYVVEHHKLPVVCLHMIIKNGAETDPLGKEGITKLTMEGLLLGTGKRSEEEISLALDSLGAVMVSEAGWDAGWIKLQGLSEDLDALLEIVCDIVLQPTFPSDAFLLLKERRLGALRNKQQDLSQVAGEAFESLLFKDTPYGHPPDGTMASVESSSVEDLRSHYSKIIHPSKMAMAIVGDVHAEEVAEKIRHLFEQGDGAAPEEGREKISLPEPSGRNVHLFLRPGFTQCQIRMGHLGISRNYPSYHAAKVMNYILGGGGFSSRLMEEIRVKRGYTYGISSRFKARKHPGPFIISTFTTPELAPEVVNRILDTIEGYRETGATEEELEAAQGFYVGSFPLGLETPSKIAGRVLETELYGLGLSSLYEFKDRIRAVRLEHILQTASSCLRPRDTIIAVMGDLEKSIQAWESIGTVHVVQDKEHLPAD